MSHLQQKHAPDKHLAIYNVAAQPKGNRVFLSGYVENPAAKSDLSAAFSQLGAEVSNDVEVLPSPKLGDRTWGIVRISVANLREQTRQGSELGSQTLMGHVVRLW